MIKVGNITIDESLVRGIGPLLVLRSADPMLYGDLRLKFELYTTAYIITVESDWLKTKGSNFAKAAELEKDASIYTDFKATYWSLQKSLEANVIAL